jgi:hypothetical protein
MGIGEFLKKQLDKQVEKGNAERNFAKNVQDLSIPFDRQLNLNPEGRELEWMDAVDLYESEYAKIRIEMGWKMVKGWEFRRGSDRFLPVRWQIGEVIVEAKYLSVDGMHIGIVQEKVLKRK